MDESQFRALRELAQDGTLSQRDLSRKMGLSLGRVNYIINSLIKSGYVKAKRFKNSRKKMAYMYVLTPMGLKRKVEVTARFLEEKTREYDRLRKEIDDLRQENLPFDREAIK